ncbi:hypothetical protein DBZ36_04700 [Alginatibacterium sediminis]|uniref:Uncharacterized protein n=1 Tax=Alginatibacterium sediminis TaxID=2164068 RepID=A0A420EGC3_9ALTE|nr:TonB-dependent receptor [Alginatibacterium sediminis]RKF19761.1 hypothetical protein DBZ36_04700 [Alginatibacterium sediminis]
MKRTSTILLVSSLLPMTTLADDLDDLMNLDLESLSMLDVEMESASKTSQKLSDIPSSVFVLSNERIKRSGYDSIAEVMTLVPGFFSAKYNEQGYNVSARGFHDSLYNKMLVLVDGRSVFSPMYGGVYWSDLDYLLHDIDRIEVLRGQGGTMWGSNAANGVVNIITKSAQATVGAYAEVNLGKYDENAVALRYGHAFDNDIYARVFYQQRNVPLTLSNEAYSRRSEVSGLTLEHYGTSNKTTFRLGGERSRYNEDYSIYYETQTLELDSHSYYAQLNHELTQANGSTLNTSLYMNYDQDDDLFSSGNYRTYDFDTNYHFEANNRSDITIGTGLRHLDLHFDKGIGSADYPEYGVLYGFTEELDIKDTIFNAYIQAQSQWSAAFSTLIGIKTEYLDRSNKWELSPQIRGLYKFNDTHAVWSGYSKMSMLPSYFDTDTTFVDDYTFYRPNPHLANESVETLEAGYRFTPNYQFYADLTAFISDYSDLRSYYYTGEYTDNYLDIVVPTNDYLAKTRGIEASSFYKHSDSLEFYLSYSFLTLEGSCASSVPSDECWVDYDIGLDSQHLASLQMLWEINHQWQFDVVTRYQSTRFPEIADSFSYDDYISFDARLAWQHQPALPRLELIGQNIGGSSTIDSWQHYQNEPQVRARISLEF